MFKSIRNWFKKEQLPQVKKIAFIDGDQPLPVVLKAYEKYVANTGTETHLVRVISEGSEAPKLLRKDNTKEINKIYLRGYASGKEITDKYIAGMIQKAVADGYNHITVISSDYDFFDIFKMSVQINPALESSTMRLIVPKAEGKMVRVTPQVANIEVIKMRTVYDKNLVDQSA